MPAKDWLVVTVVCSVTFLNVFLSGALTVASPDIAKQLGFKQADIQWPLNAFACVLLSSSSLLSFLSPLLLSSSPPPPLSSPPPLLLSSPPLLLLLIPPSIFTICALTHARMHAHRRLSYGCSLLFFGKVADIVGSRLMFLVGSAWVFVWALATSFAPTAQTFIAFIALQGIGAAANTPAGISILSAYFPPGPAKNRAFSLLGAGQPVGFIVGLIGGSLLMQAPNANGRRGIFWIEAFLALFMFALGWFVLPADKRSPEHEHGEDGGGKSRWRKHVGELDWVGAGLSTAGIALLTYDLAESTSAPHGWRTPYVPVLLIISLLLLTSFILYEHHLSSHPSPSNPSLTPLLPPHLFTQPHTHLLPVVLLVFFGWWNFNTLSYLTTLYYQQVRFYAPLPTAARFVPLTIAAFAYLLVAGRVVHRVRARTLVVGGLAGNLAATLIFALMPTRAPYWSGAFLVMLFLPGADIAYTVVNLHVCAAFDARAQGLAGSVFVVATRLGTSIGLAVTQAVITAVSRPATPTSTPPTSASSATDADADADRLMQGLRAGAWTCLGAVGISMAVGAVFLGGIGVVGSASASVGAKDAEGAEGERVGVRESGNEGGGGGDVEKGEERGDEKVVDVDV
ncbi:MFS general substrate transporter [Trametopsis cervina]|nr:MFS general substrate transporter [Trametopsis cervina]